MNLLRDLVSGVQAVTQPGRRAVDTGMAVAQGINRSTPWGQAHQRQYNELAARRAALQRNQPPAAPRELSYPGYIDPNQQLDPTVPGLRQQYYERAKYL